MTNKEPGLINAEGKQIISDERLIKTFNDRIAFIGSVIGDLKTINVAIIESAYGDVDYDAAKVALNKVVEARMWAEKYLEVIYTQYPGGLTNPYTQYSAGKTEWSDKFDTHKKRFTELRRMLKHLMDKFFSNPPITTIPSESMFGSESIKKMMEAQMWIKELTDSLED